MLGYLQEPVLLITIIYHLEMFKEKPRNKRISDSEASEVILQLLVSWFKLDLATIWLKYCRCGVNP